MQFLAIVNNMFGKANRFVVIFPLGTQGGTGGAHPIVDPDFVLMYNFLSPLYP